MKNIKTTWDMTMLYASPKDPAIERDIAAIEKACEAFAGKWRTDSSYTKKPALLLEALKQYEHLLHVIGDWKPLAYFLLYRDIDGANASLSARASQVQERLTNATNQVLFFEIEIGGMAPDLQKRISKLSDFKHFLYFLEKSWKTAAHRLSSGEEQIMALKSEPSHQLWVAATEKLISGQQISWKGKMVPINQAIGMVPGLNAADRLKLHSLVMAKYKEISPTATAELNAICINKKIDDQLRHFKNAYSATILDYQNDEPAIESMIATVDTHQTYAHQFFRAKADLMGVTKLNYSDINATLAVKKRVISFEEGCAIVMRALERVSAEYALIFRAFLVNGQIDVYPRVGKRGGGYCWGSYNQPTYILLNWTDDVHSVMTLAHEMGHAIHRELAKKQGVMYESHPISIAEAASTLFENFAFEELLVGLPQREATMARANRVQEAVATVFRQSVGFMFEKGMHRRIRAEGQLSAESLAAIMKAELAKHVGRQVVLGENDGYRYVGWMHIRSFFYVYSYIYGKLVSNVLYANYVKDPAYLSKINQFLSAGGSNTPEKIFASIGVDTSHDSFWKKGLDEIGSQIAQLAKDVKKMK